MARLQRSRSISTISVSSASSSGNTPSTLDSHGPTGVFHHAAHSLIATPKANASDSPVRPSSMNHPRRPDRVPLERRSTVEHGTSVHATSQKMWRAVSKLNGTTDAIEEEVTVENAESMLTEAILAQDAGALLRAISQGRSSGVDRKFIEEGTKVLQRLEWKSSLQQAVKEENLLRLEEVLRRVEKVGLDEKDMKEAQELISTIHAEERLRTAIGMNDFNAIHWALEYAITGVRHETIVQAHLALRQIEIKGRLKAAIHTKKKSDIMDSLNDAVACGFVGPLVDEAQHILDAVNKAEKSHVISTHFVPKPGEHEAAMLAQAVKMRDVSSLRMALRAAKDAGMPKSERAPAMKFLEQLEAQLGLERAIRCKDHKKLHEAFTHAETSGLEGSKEMEVVQKLVATLDATKELDDAVKSRRAGDLHEAIEKARSCGVVGMPLEKAERILAQLEVCPKAVLEAPVVRRTHSKRSSAAAVAHPKRGASLGDSTSSSTLAATGAMLGSTLELSAELEAVS